MTKLIDNTQHEKAQKKVDRRHEREMSDVRFLLTRPEGRRFIWKLMSKGRIFQEPFCNENTNGTNYNLGRMSISRDVLNDVMEASPSSFLQLQQEHAAELVSDANQEEIDRKLEEKGGFGLTTD